MSKPKTFILTFNQIIPTNNVLMRWHWAKRNKEIKNWRTLVAFECHRLEIPRHPAPMIGRIRVDTVIYWPSKKGRRPDQINVQGAVDKLVVDALVKLGYLKDDSDEFVEWGKVEHIVDPMYGARTEVILKIVK